MKNMLRVRYLLLTSFFGLFAVLQAHGQMKIGSHPTQIHKSAILELESNKQGLLLTRIRDTSDMTALNPPDGMIIYSVQDTSLYIRANYRWKKLVDSAQVGGSFWNLKGNDFTADDSTDNILGTSNEMGFRIGANGKTAIAIDRNGNAYFMDSVDVAGNANFNGKVAVRDSLRVGNRLLNVIMDSTYIGNALFVNDSVRLKVVSDALPDDDSVLVLGADHVIRKMSLDAVGIRKIAGLTGPDVYVTVDRDSTDFGIDSTSVPNTLTFHVPYANGVKGSARNGLVDSLAQSFAGAKSFRDSVAIGSTAAPGAILDVNGSVNMKIAFVNPLDNYDMSTTAADANVRTVIFDVSDIVSPTTYTVTLPTAVNGRIYTIKKVGKSDDNQIDENVKIIPSGSDAFGDGTVGPLYIYNNFTSVTLQAQNKKWYIVGH